MTRIEAIAAHESAGTIDYTATPLEAGMGACPWRIAIAATLRIKADHDVARRVLASVFRRWPTPEALIEATMLDVASLLAPLNLHRRKARTLLMLSRAWLGEGWQNVIELPRIGQEVNDAIERYSRRGPLT